ncbi:MAG: hypothetical protein ACNA7T_01235 [Haliea sp.]
MQLSCKQTRALALVSLLLPLQVLADGSVIDKIYHPYVNQLEWELEWRAVQQREDPATGEARYQTHKLGLGRAVTEYVFAEVYLIGEGSADRSLQVSAWEAEVLWQMSEQGEYLLDYGLLFELEKARGEDVWEYATTLLLERELGRFSATANVGVVYEWGDDIADELETTAALQARYRHSPLLEPALELYLGEDTRALGPVLLGMARLGERQALRWEAGIVWGLDHTTADYSVRALLEYEF